MKLPSIRDFAAHAHNSACYAALPGDWHVAAADVEGSTKLAAQGRDRDVNFIAGAVVAAMNAVISTPDQPAACQFGGDGAVAAVPPDKVEAVRAALSALGWWSLNEMDVSLRVGMVPVSELNAQGHTVLAGLQDFGNTNVFGQFLGSGVPVAEHWVKADQRWRIPLVEGDLPGLEGLSCRWRPVPPRRGSILCLIIDPTDVQGRGLDEVQARLEAVVSTEKAAPLGDGDDLAPAVIPPGRLLDIEARTSAPSERARRKIRAVLGSAILGVIHRLGGKLFGIDVIHYRRTMAERSDYRKLAGGPRMVLDLTADEIKQVLAVLDQAETEGLILYGHALSKATTVTCMVGDFSADRHVHFVDGDELGFWRASLVLKEKLKAQAS